MAEYGNSSTGKENTFGRSLMNYVNTYLPYGSYNTLDTIEKLNPKFIEFQDTGSKRAEALTKNSTPTHRLRSLILIQISLNICTLIFRQIRLPDCVTIE